VARGGVVLAVLDLLFPLAQLAGIFRRIFIWLTEIRVERSASIWGNQFAEIRSVRFCIGLPH
jgi:hypothetical protein